MQTTSIGKLYRRLPSPPTSMHLPTPLTKIESLVWEEAPGRWLLLAVLSASLLLGLPLNLHLSQLHGCPLLCLILRACGGQIPRGKANHYLLVESDACLRFRHRKTIISCLALANCPLFCFFYFPLSFPFHLQLSLRNPFLVQVITY